MNLAPLHIVEVAQRLSVCNRWAGATTRFPVSVALHSVLVASILPVELKLWGLLHDAPEAYTGDLLSPLKAQVPALKELDQAIMQGVCARYSLAWPEPPEVKAADLAVTAAELAQVVLGSSWPVQPLSRPAEIVVPQMDWETARWLFLETFDELTGMNSKEAIKILKARGWKHVRTRGDHHIFKHPDKAEILTIMHPMRDMPVYLVKVIERLLETRLQQLTRREKLALRKAKAREKD